MNLPKIVPKVLEPFPKRSFRGRLIVFEDCWYGLVDQNATESIWACLVRSPSLSAAIPYAMHNYRRAFFYYQTNISEGRNTYPLLHLRRGLKPGQRL